METLKKIDAATSKSPNTTTPVHVYNRAFRRREVAIQRHAPVQNKKFMLGLQLQKEKDVRQANIAKRHQLNREKSHARKNLNK